MIHGTSSPIAAPPSTAIVLSSRKLPTFTLSRTSRISHVAMAVTRTATIGHLHERVSHSDAGTVVRRHGGVKRGHGRRPPPSRVPAALRDGPTIGPSDRLEEWDVSEIDEGLITGEQVVVRTNK